ncbi:MAG TPA: ABC transporter permease [Dehalococcoidia bacterium]|nr:ABC transporter permease [Dehalococcoidia bacterium]
MQESARVADAIGKQRRHLPFLVDVVVRLIKEKPLGSIGLFIVITLLAAGIFADWLAPYSYMFQDLDHILEPPSAEFLLGTDNLGRCLLSRIIYGARISMIVGLSVPAISSVMQLFIGGLAGFFGGKWDMIVMRFVDTMMCFPGLVIMLTVVAIIGPGLVQLVLLLGILGGLGGANRATRSYVINIRENVYVEAARAIGAPDLRIMFRHIVPNILPLVIVGFTMNMGGAILAESSLSFLGFGIPPPFPSWGGMLSGNARRYMFSAPWMAIWPGLALAIVVWGMNMFGDGVRDVLDPRLRGGLGSYRLNAKKLEKVLKKVRSEENTR